MARKVFCRKYKQELAGLLKPPFPGPQGQLKFEEVSQKAWDDWIAHQTTLINEKRLNMLDHSARTYLAEQRLKFLSGENYDIAEGYVPDN